MNEAKLKRKFIQGNKKAFDVIYNDYSKAMYMICLRYTKNTDAAADILQEAFIKIYNKREQFNPEFPLASWIKRIVINEAINYFRSNKRYELVEDNTFFDDDNYEIEINEDETGNLQNVLKAIIDELPDGYRMVFNLYVYDNLKHQEIAEYLDISVNTSKSQLSKARKYLQKKLEEKNITSSVIYNG
ncbi:RNA polymerase sigma factor [Crocinitomix catalasitica]|uniref:RNA polymerase sigma factor n=1 Tax=Crocinitomix catalasitica TaxID=184607 RepID=UPI00047FB428|nr:RNA polymerase sigma factor [Crocinitomix catalasitica]